MNWKDAQKIKVGEGLRWRINTLCIEVFRYQKEWLICWDMDSETLDNEGGMEVLEENSLPTIDSNHERYVVKATLGKIGLMPKTADRPVVIRPRDPFILPSHEEATLFVSTPLWIEVFVNTPDTALKELPVRRLSDTWFGPSLLKGDLCYDSRTRGVLELGHLEYRPSRIVTPLLIRNLAETSLMLERVSLPVPLLSVFQADDGKLWTEQLSLTREEDGEMAALKIANNAPKQAPKARKISSPRQQSEKNTLIRAFGGIFA